MMQFSPEPELSLIAYTFYLQAFYRCAGFHEVLVWAASHLPETILDFIIR